MIQHKEYYYIYMILLSNNTIYTGMTSNLSERIMNHINGKGSKIARSFKPIEILQAWRIYESKNITLQVEHCIKKLTKHEKQNLINNPKELTAVFYQYSSKKIKKRTLRYTEIQKKNIELFPPSNLIK